MNDNKTRFGYKGVYMRISKDYCGRDRFTIIDIIDAIDNNEVEVRGDRDHCLCRKSDGKVFAEIISKD